LPTCSTACGSTLSNDQLPGKRLDFQFVNPPYGFEWSKDFDAVGTREPMPNNPSVRQRLSASAANFPTFHFSMRPARRRGAGINPGFPDTQI